MKVSEVVDILDDRDQYVPYSSVIVDVKVPDQDKGEHIRLDSFHNILRSTVIIMFIVIISSFR